MDDFRRIFYGVLIGFVLMIIVWISFLTFSGCGSSLNCAFAGPTPQRTSIPTLVPGTLPPNELQLGAATEAGTQAASAPTTTGTQTEPEATEEVARPVESGRARAGRQFDRRCERRATNLCSQLPGLP